MRIYPNPHSNDEQWSSYLQSAITHLPDLLQALDLPIDDPRWDHAAEFPLLVPLPFLHRMEKGNPNDPLLQQVLPQHQERISRIGFHKDPLAESQHRPQKALIHKYKSRVLVITTGQCAINCRYCFRRHFPYADNQLAQAEWQSVLDYLQTQPDVNEVIFSGGDPLIMKDKLLAARVASLEQLPQIKRLRIHTRLPIVIPQRVDDALLGWIRASRLDIIFVLHSNHANELDHQVAHAMMMLRQQGVTLLNQGVLLRGINDSVAAQVNLSEALFRIGILPYYLFTLDPVEGAAHFDLSLLDAQKLMGQVAAHLPGYLLPRLAKEIPGQVAKTLFSPLMGDIEVIVSKE